MSEQEFSVDKTVFDIVPLSRADDDRTYWLSKSPEERLRAV